LLPEKRVVLKNCELIDPGDITSFLGRNGFSALTRALGLSPEAVIGELKASGLRGRGGAGFPCGLKWELARQALGEEKFVICNADEGEVGTFKDRYILQHDPFTLIEGLAIAAHAVGARRAYIYLRAEYHYLLAGLRQAIDQSAARGFLGHVDIQICEGAGAYICGEESALMESIEGKRGEARYKPPFPPTRGLWGKPTVINNVETLMNIPPILLNGAQWFSRIGTEKSKGTKVFSISGDVGRAGVCEFEMGSRLDELVVDWAMSRDVKLVQVGGATGAVLPRNRLGTPLAFETVLGSGAVMVLGRQRDTLDFVAKTVEFLAEESCGKCTPCREGTEVLLEILGRLARGDGWPDDLPTLERLSRVMALSSLCGLGQAAAVPVMDTLKYFRSDYEIRLNQAQLLRSLSGNQRQPGEEVG
jgi:NADH:ubiquinone oxidoreductase subunit F (NADH-binding)